MIFELETALKTKLETISRFKIVYDHFVLASEWYPYASFELSDFDGAFLDCCSNQREFTFNIVIIQEISAERVTRQKAKEILYNCLEDVVTAFDGDQDLWEWTIVKGNVSRGQMWTFTEKEWSVLALNVELNLEIVTNAW